jgi:hypothetical protein
MSDVLPKQLELRWLSIYVRFLRMTGEEWRGELCQRPPKHTHLKKRNLIQISVVYPELKLAGSETS